MHNLFIGLCQKYLWKRSEGPGVVPPASPGAKPMVRGYGDEAPEADDVLL